MPELLIASQNVGKVKEIRAVLADTAYTVLTPEDVGLDATFDVEETGETYQENSELKAIAFGRVALILTLADDSGLSVNALDGRPGVYSKRYAPGTDSDRNQKLLTEMSGLEDRSAAFITVLCLYDPETNTSNYFEGKISGEIALAEQGDEGFGYDPIFIPVGFTQTFAELGLETKNQLSHRAQALEKLKQFLIAKK